MSDKKPSVEAADRVIQSMFDGLFEPADGIPDVIAVPALPEDPSERERVLVMARLILFYPDEEGEVIERAAKRIIAGRREAERVARELAREFAGDQSGPEDPRLVQFLVRAFDEGADYAASKFAPAIPSAPLPLHQARAEEPDNDP